MQTIRLYDNRWTADVSASIVTRGEWNPLTRDFDPDQTVVVTRSLLNLPGEDEQGNFCVPSVASCLQGLRDWQAYKHAAEQAEADAEAGIERVLDCRVDCHGRDRINAETWSGSHTGDWLYIKRYPGSVTACSKHTGETYHLQLDGDDIAPWMEVEEAELRHEGKLTARSSDDDIERETARICVEYIAADLEDEAANAELGELPEGAIYDLYDACRLSDRVSDCLMSARDQLREEEAAIEAKYHALYKQEALLTYDDLVELVARKAQLTAEVEAFEPWGFRYKAKLRRDGEAQYRTLAIAIIREVLDEPGDGDGNVTRHEKTVEVSCSREPFFRLAIDCHEKPVELDEDGEPTSWEIIGYRASFN